MMALLMGLVCLPVMAGDNVVLVEKTVAESAKGASLSLTLNNQDRINGLQFDIHLPKGVTVVDDKNNSPKQTERLKGLNLVCREISEGVYRFLAFSMNGSFVLGNTGAIVVIPLQFEPSFAKGEYEVKLTNVMLSVNGPDNTNSSSTSPDNTGILIVQ